MPRWDSVYPESARPQREVAATGLVGLASSPKPALRVDRIHRLVVGIDAKRPVEMSDAEIAGQLNDPLATVVLRQSHFPKDVHEVLAVLDAAGALLQTHAFLASEGGQIQDRVTPIDRQFRWVITRADQDQRPDLLISTGAEGDLSQSFLQILAWDAVNGVFNYYQRLQQEGVWVYSGCSDDALRAPTRGKGAFDSHVNGSMVMKELRSPWQNWHSNVASIDTTLGDATLQHSPFLKAPILQGAEDLETIVKGGINRWTKARFAAIHRQGSIEDPIAILRQVVAGTTFNLRSAHEESDALEPDGRVTLPASFFVDEATLLTVLKIPASLPAFTVPGSRYLEALQAFDLHLQTKGFRQEGDTFFAFLVPEPAQEDFDVLQEAITAGWINAKFAACARMVDFPNPVRSPRRARLLSHAPQSASLDPGALGERMAQRIVAAATPASPEAEFAGYWATVDWQAAFAERIDDYVTKARRLLDTGDGFATVVRLADSRRRDIGVGRVPLSEFDLLLPHTNVPDTAPLLEMTEDAELRPKALDH
jgi:hypothetical protein